MEKPQKPLTLLISIVGCCVIFHQLADLQINLNKYKNAPGFDAKSFKEQRKMLARGGLDFYNRGNLDNAVENFQNHLRLVRFPVLVFTYASSDQNVVSEVQRAIYTSCPHCLICSGNATASTSICQEESAD